jgi:Domain of unknown function (DUF4404)
MNQRLQKLLRELHTELNSAEAIDADARTQLQDLARDIQVVVDSAADGNGQQGGEHQLQQAVLQFETEHPRIAGILSQIADALARLGI